MRPASCGGWGQALHGQAVVEGPGHSSLGLFAQALIEQELCADTRPRARNDTDKHPCPGETD